MGADALGYHYLAVAIGYLTLRCMPFFFVYIAIL